MPTFSLPRIGCAGEGRRGEVIADDDRCGDGPVAARGVFPSELRQANGQAISGAPSRRRPLLPRRRHAAADVLPRFDYTHPQLSNLVSGGIALIPAVVALTEHTENAQLRDTLTHIEQISRVENRWGRH